MYLIFLSVYWGCGTWPRLSKRVSIIFLTLKIVYVEIHKSTNNRICIRDERASSAAKSVYSAYHLVFYRWSWTQIGSYIIDIMDAKTL